MNYFFFSMINATPASSPWMISFATFIARDLIMIIPILLVGMWLWGPQSDMDSQRALVTKAAIAIAWSRIYLGVHWPLDMVGGFLLGIVGCLFAQLVWNLFGDAISNGLKRLYQVGFALPISRGWVRN
ncbi:phosphatase PAP2 family protein [Yersinia enterocolitica]|nr:phosphatase PAP2 family protein [Yersinia enterocolitica]